MENFEVMKNAWDRMGQAERRKFAEQHKDNANFQQFAKQYSQGATQPQQTSTPAPTTPQPSNPAPVANNQQNQTPANGQNWGNGSGNPQTSPSQQPSYNPSEQFDSSAFNNPNAQVQVQAGNAKQTGMPDYQDNSDARMNEITNNLNAYWNTNREYFSDRQTFNRNFQYEKRNESQKALLDSFRKRKELDQKVAGYTDGKSVSLALEQGVLTKAQLEALKVQNPKVYTEYLEDQLNKKNLDLVNTSSPSRIFNEDEQISHNTDALTDMMRKLGFDMSADGRARELYEKFKELKADPKIDTMKQDYLEARKIYLQRRREFNTLPERIRAQSTGASESLISARISKAQRLAYNELQTLADEAQIRKEEYVLEYGEMKDEFNAFKMQADEDYRAFTSKMSSLGFAKGLLGFETPEQQRQGQLRQQKDLNDLNLQFAKDKANLESELTDINSKDPQTQRTALMKALDQYYKDFGSIILRPQSQVVDDILALAKKEGISVGEAMRKNFTEPLQKKPEYRAMLSKLTGVNAGDKMLKVGDKIFIQTTHADGSTSIKEYGGANLGWGSGGLLNVSVPATYQGPNYTPASIERVQAGLKQINAQGDGSKGGQCGYFVNNYLQSLGIGRLFTDPISAKKAVVNSSTPSIGSVAVIDRTNSPNTSQAQKKYGHVGVVTKINADGSVVLKQSNKNGEEKVFTSTYRADQVYGYFDPTISKEQATASIGGEISTSYDNSIVDFLQKDHSKFNSTQWKAIEKAGYSVSEYLAQKQAYQNSVAKEITDTEIALLKDLYEMKKAGGSARRLSNFWAVPGTASADFDVAYNNFKSNLTLKNLIDSKAKGATFGALSDNELKFLESAASRLDKKATSEKFKAELNSIITNMEAKIRERGGDLSQLGFYQEVKNQANPNSLNLAGFAQYQINNTPYGGYAEELDL